MKEKLIEVGVFLLTALIPFALIFGVAIFIAGAITLFRKIKTLE